MNIDDFLRDNGWDGSRWDSERIVYASLIKDLLNSHLWTVGQLFFGLDKKQVSRWIYNHQGQQGALETLGMQYASWLLADEPIFFEPEDIYRLCGDGGSLDGQSWNPEQHNLRGKTFCSDQEMKDFVLRSLSGQKSYPSKKFGDPIRTLINSFAKSWLAAFVSWNDKYLMYRRVPTCSDVCNQGSEVDEFGSCPNHAQHNCRSVICWKEGETNKAFELIRKEVQYRFFQVDQRKPLIRLFCKKCGKRVPFRTVVTKTCAICGNPVRGCEGTLWFTKQDGDIESHAWRQNLEIDGESDAFMPTNFVLVRLANLTLQDHDVTRVLSLAFDEDIDIDAARKRLNLESGEFKRKLRSQKIQRLVSLASLVSDQIEEQALNMSELTDEKLLDLASSVHQCQTKTSETIQRS